MGEETRQPEASSNLPQQIEQSSLLGKPGGENDVPKTLDRVLLFFGVEPRVYRVILSALLVMDFRNQFFGRSTATGGPKEILTPLFTVTGQNR